MEKVREMFLNVPKLIIPIMSDHKAHWCDNRLSFAYIFNIHTHQELMLGFNHNDLPNFEKEVLSPFLNDLTVVYKKKLLLGIDTYDSILDAEMVFWLKTNQRLIFDIDPIVKKYWTDYRDVPNTNDFIPIMRHLETCRSIKDNVLTYISNLEMTDYLIKYQKILDNLVEIEAQGIFTIENT